MPRTRTSKSQKKRQTRKNTPKKKDDIILSNAARSIAGNQVIDRLAIKVKENPSSRNMKRYSNAVASLLQSKIESDKSYAPSINEKLTSIRSQKYSDLFGCGAEFELGKTRVFNKLMIKSPMGTCMLCCLSLCASHDQNKSLFLRTPRFLFPT